MSFYLITIIIGLILLLIFKFVSKHLYFADYGPDGDERIRTFKLESLAVWEVFVALLCVFIPVIGQIFLFSIILSYRVSLDHYEVFSFTDLNGLTWDDYIFETSEYRDRYNKAPFYAKICRKLKKLNYVQIVEKKLIIDLLIV